MCVIVNKPAGVAIKSTDLYQMWQANPHGAGLAFYREDGTIEVQKGFMKLKELRHALESLDHEDVIVHFRLATHGKKNQEQTHPFVVTTKIDRCKQVNPPKARSILFHNGIVSGYGCDKISDTIDFVTSVIARIPEVDVRVDVLGLEGSSYVLMQDGYIYTIGDFREYAGLSCSNLYWCTPIISSNEKRYGTYRPLSPSYKSAEESARTFTGAWDLDDYTSEDDLYRSDVHAIKFDARYERYINNEMTEEEEREYEYELMKGTAFPESDRYVDEYYETGLVESEDSEEFIEDLDIWNPKDE